MSNSTDLLSIFIPLTAADRQQAASLARLQMTTEAATRVYHNALAVLATAQYLKMLDIESDLTASYSLNPAVQLVADMADLYIPEARERIECRSVYSGETSAYIPEEVWEDRLGFVVVQVDDAGTKADLLGFVPEVTVEQLPLSYLRPLDGLVDVIEDVLSIPVINNVSEWLKGIFKEIWQPIDSLPAGGVAYGGPRGSSLGLTETKSIQQMYAAQKRDLPPVDPDTPAEVMLANIICHAREEEARFKAAEALWEIDPTNPVGGVKRVMDLGLYIEGYSIGLLSAVLPRPDGRQSMMFQVYPVRDARFLPSGLKLIALDENGHPLLEIGARSQDDRISLKLVADPGDRFSIQVVLNDASVTEPFIV